MRHASLLLSAALLGSVAWAACSANGNEVVGGVGGSGAGSGTGAGAGSPSGTGAGTTGSLASTGSTGATSTGATSTAGSSGPGATTGPGAGSGGATSGTGGSGSGGPINFTGGWMVPDAGRAPPLVGDGGTTTEIGPGADSSSPGKFGGPVNGAAPTIVYPPNGVVLPPNTNALEFHFIPGAGQTLFKFTFHAPSTNLVVYTGCTAVGGGCVFTPDATFWSSLVDYARGTAPVTYTIEGVKGSSPGSVGTSAEASLAFGDQNMAGGIYYWNTSGIIQRYDYGYPAAAPENYLTAIDVQAAFCVGCHVMSRDGNKLAVGQDIPAPAGYKVLDTLSKAVEQSTTGPDTGAASFFSFSPDEKHLLQSDGIAVYWRWLETGQYHDNTGTIGTKPVVASGTMPDWSPDGLHMVYAKPKDAAFFAVPGVSSASIMQLHFNGVGWDTEATLVPFAGQNNYYPAYSPTGDWVAFNRSPQNAESFSNASPDPDAGTMPDGELWAVKSTGGTAVRLSAASDPGALSWPKWAPVLHTYHGGKILWLTFSSARAYGLRLAKGAQTQLWMAGFDLEKAAAGQDPSLPAFWLPFQDIGGGNHIAQWTTNVPRGTCSATKPCPNGEVCSATKCIPQ